MSERGKGEIAARERERGPPIRMESTTLSREMAHIAMAPEFCAAIRTLDAATSAADEERSQEQRAREYIIAIAKNERGLRDGHSTVTRVSDKLQIRPDIVQQALHYLLRSGTVSYKGE